MYINIYIYLYTGNVPSRLLPIHQWPHRKSCTCHLSKSKFSKGISGEVVSSKVPTNTPRVLHAETTRGIIYIYILFR